MDKQASSMDLVANGILEIDISRDKSPRSIKMPSDLSAISRKFRRPCFDSIFETTRGLGLPNGSDLSIMPFSSSTSLPEDAKER